VTRKSATTAPTTALLTDHYELTMLQAALASGAAHRRSVFELFGRRIPGGRRYGVVAGTGRVLDALESFRFDAEDIDYLRSRHVVDEPTLDYLASYRFGGDIWGYAEGDLWFPHSPVLVVEASFAEAVLLETLLLSILNHDSAVATAASRMTSAADGRGCIEMGSRRTHELAAVAAARAASIAGFTATSNLEAGRRYGVPTTGTSAHAFTLLHDCERDAFRAQVDSLGQGTTLLVDTYDIAEAVRLAVEVAGTDLGAVRVDSGDLVELAHRVRAQLDSLGATGTKIVVTSDLDEYAIAGLRAAPVDGYGVGTQLVTGSGHPTCGFVYKLVTRRDDAGNWIDVAKISPEKSSVGGRKYASRRYDDDTAIAEVIRIGLPDSAPALPADERALLVPLVESGKVVGRESLDRARQRHQEARASLPLQALRLTKGDPALPVEVVTVAP
jgi:nicotinate phosphoribosyltransferase